MRSIPEMNESDVLIVGAGPVGLTLAIDLAWRGINVTIAETRARAAPPEPKCNHVAARTMEIFRRLGLAEAEIRRRGAVPDEIEDAGAAGELARAEVGRLAYEINVQQYACAGLNFGTYYDRSPIIAYDGAEQPAYTMNSYKPSTVSDAVRRICGAMEAPRSTTSWDRSLRC
jgi:choline dehydrogenase-like flavoprotein